MPLVPPPAHQCRYGPPVLAVYRTSAINLTSALHLVIPAGVQLRGTEDFTNNCGGDDTASCDGLDSPTWPVLPWMAYPSPANIGGGRPAKQAFIRCYNCSDVQLSGGGEIDGGGGWWWCARMWSAVPPQPAGGHAPRWCPEMVAAKKVPKLTLDAPHFIHFVESRRIKVSVLFTVKVHS